MTIHELKTWPDYFQAVWDGTKTFEVRKNDRGFQPNDRLLLKEWDPDSASFTDRSIMVLVPYVLQGGQFGVEPGWCVLSITVVARAQRL